MSEPQSERKEACPCRATGGANRPSLYVQLPLITEHTKCGINDKTRLPHPAGEGLQSLQIRLFAQAPSLRRSHRIRRDPSVRVPVAATQHGQSCGWGEGVILASQMASGSRPQSAVGPPAYGADHENESFFAERDGAKGALADTGRINGSSPVTLQFRLDPGAACLCRPALDGFTLPPHIGVEPRFAGSEVPDPHPRDMAADSLLTNIDRRSHTSAEPFH